LKKTLTNIIKLSIAFGLGIFIIWVSLKDLTAVEKDNILNSFRVADYSWVIYSVIIGILSHFVRALRWRMLLKPMGYSPTIFHSFLSVMVGYFANMGIPRSGELARCTVLYRQEKIPVDKSFGTVILERAIDLVIFFALFSLALITEYKRIDAYVQERIYPKISEKFDFIQTEHLFGRVSLSILIGSLILFLIFRKRIMASKVYKKFMDVIKGVGEGLISIGKIKQPGLFILYSLTIWVFYYLMVYVTLFALEETSHLSLGAGLSVLVLGSIGIMVTPGGIGLYPVLVAETLTLYGIAADSGIGLAMGWITWSAQTFMILAIGGAALFIISFRPKKKIDES
jgi:uncharacterized protein (TIRG00374 family)